MENIEPVSENYLINLMEEIEKTGILVVGGYNVFISVFFERYVFL